MNSSCKFMRSVAIVGTIILLNVGSARSQFVVIPDPNFVNALSTSPFSGCMSGNLMDTICVQNTISAGDTTLIVGNSNINNLDGIQYFAGLKILFASQNNITAFPILPSSIDSVDLTINEISSVGVLHEGLRSIGLGGNNITSIGFLPSTLKVLEVILNNLTSLPPLPTGLKYLWCDYNSITTLPTLPDSLKFISCTYNQLASITGLPNGLKDIWCSHNQISNISALPNSLYGLICDDNLLTSLPSLPNGLHLLYCDSNQLTALPTLPSSLKILTCSQNQLTSIPSFPTDMHLIDCSYNLFTILPNFPNMYSGSGLIDISYNFITTLPTLTFTTQAFDCSHNLITSMVNYPVNCNGINVSYNQLNTIPAITNNFAVINCSHNLIDTLPTLPDTLNVLDCGNNLLTELPELPNYMNSLRIDSNNISCLPILPLINDDFEFSANPIYCLPNYPIYSFSNPDIWSFPLCYPGNSSGCPYAANVSGVTFLENDNNCMFNAGDTIVGCIPIKVYQGSTFIQQQSPYYGQYSFNLYPGTYTLKIDTSSSGLSLSCFNFPVDTTITIDTGSTTINWGFTCDAQSDLVASPLVRDNTLFPGLAVKFSTCGGISTQLLFSQFCDTFVSGQVIINVSGPLAYLYPAPGALTPTSVSGLNLVYDIPDFSLINPFQDFAFYVKVDTTAQLTDTVCTEVIVVNSNPELDTSNNQFNFCYTVQNSYDPNSKDVYPLGDLPYPFNETMDYIIHFQNTGTAPAINIRLRDTIDSDFDLSTLRVLSASHPFSMVVVDSIVDFHFPNIYLADSTSDEPNSHGYIHYQITPKLNLAPGVLLTNRANIYFDYNSPILTNMTINEIVLNPNSINEQQEPAKLVLYPVPVSDYLNIKLASNKGTVLVYDVNGAVHKRINVETSNFVMDVSELPNGIFILVYEGLEGIACNKFIVQH